MPLARRRDVLDQILAIALHPSSDCETTFVSASIFINLAQSPETHTYIAGRETMEKILEMCELKQKMVSGQTSQSQQGNNKDAMEANALKYDICNFFLSLIFL